MASRTREHESAVEAFVDEVATADVDALERLVLFGSVARETHTADSDIDVLAVFEDGTDVTAAEERLRTVAYDVMLEYGTVFSVHGVTETTMTERSDHPFFTRIRDEGRTIYG